MFDRILVPVDGSDGALAALRQAILLQEKFASQLFILSVYRHYSLLEASMSMVRPEAPENLDDSMREYATGVVEQAKQIARNSGVADVRGFVKSGPPARTIVQFATEREINLIILGSRGVGDIENYLLGSVSHKVTSLAQCPVMVV
ncbi:universal stress protein [Aestuariispira insulae]|uniref:Nucleotide-binding universal stress UspA family protein n=1 Tax=Aestuariispira insulae TaxID=1461337 RepID=A0A3D9H3C7_9PROT|nr:universal stress protein [Aestuariispira insulae]RED43396.1 nucleotide-binding universal stress UspA family protein [Aestuariispira insulae]